MYKRILSIILCFALCFLTLNVISCKKDESFTVTFSSGHEDAYLYYGKETQQVKNSKQIEEPIYVRKGYNFAGWNVSISRINKDTNVVAQWTRYDMSIVFYANGGKDDDGNRSVSIIANSAFDIMEKAPQFKRKGYTLSWSIPLESITKSCTIDAIWTLNEYDFTFKDMHGNDFDGNTLSVKYNEVLDFSSISAPIEQGKKFAYWADDDGVPLDNGIVWDNDNGTTLNAVYVSQSEFVINYDFNGAIRQSQDIQRSFNQQSLINLTDPMRIGYVFDGWQINGKSQKYFSNEITLEHFKVNGNFADVNLKATWEKRPYTAIFDSDGGQIIGQSQMEFYYGYEIENLPIVQKENYEFVGWFYDGDEIKHGNVWDYAEDITIKAVYRAKYKVKFSLSSSVGVNNTEIVCKVVKWGDIASASSLEDVEIELLEGQSLFSAKEISILPVVDPIEQYKVNEYFFSNYWKYVDSSNIGHKVAVSTIFNQENLPDIKAGDTIVLVPHIKIAWTPHY